MADSIIEQSFSDFTTEIYYHCCEEVDVIEFQETENKLVNLVGKEKFEAFQLMLTQYFIANSFTQVFLQAMIKELSLANRLFFLFQVHIRLLFLHLHM